MDLGDVSGGNEKENFTRDKKPVKGGTSNRRKFAETAVRSSRVIEVPVKEWNFHIPSL